MVMKRKRRPKGRDRYAEPSPVWKYLALVVLTLAAFVVTVVVMING